MRNITKKEQALIKSFPKGSPERNGLIWHFINRNIDWNNAVNHKPVTVKSSYKYRVNPSATTKKRRPLDKLPAHKKQAVPLTHKTKDETCPEGYFGPTRHGKKGDTYERYITEPKAVEDCSGVFGEPNERDFSLDRASGGKIDITGNPNLDRASRMFKGRVPGRKRKKGPHKKQYCPTNNVSGNEFAGKGLSNRVLKKKQKRMNRALKSMKKLTAQRSLTINYK